MKHNKGFTLIELLVALAIIVLMGSIVLVSLKSAKDRANSARTLTEMKSLGLALVMYLMDNDYNYPCDVSRDLPSGLEKYLSTNPNWPKAPWPGSVYDWDYWHPDPASTGFNPDGSGNYCAGNLGYNPKTEPVYQLSIRFCDINGNNCQFPNEEWATNFDRYSSVYWCISGPCRAHGSMPYNHPGCCIGGNCPIDQPFCEL